MTASPRARRARPNLRSSLSSGVRGSHLLAAGWAVVLVAWAIAIAAGSVHFVGELTSTLLVLGFLGATLWVTGSVSQAVGWMALRAARGGHARGVAVFEVALAGGYLIVPILAFWGLPFLWIPAYVALCLWHAAAATWFHARPADLARVGPGRAEAAAPTRADPARLARAAAIGHAGAALGLALALVCGELGSAPLLAAALPVGGASALVGHLATGRYMAAMKPWLEVLATFE